MECSDFPEVGTGLTYGEAIPSSPPVEMMRPLSYRSSGDVFFLLGCPETPCIFGNFWQEWQLFGNRQVGENFSNLGTR